MTPIEGADFGVLAAIAAMAVATYAMRAGGFWMMRTCRRSARLRKMLEALPGSVIVAAVLPIVVRDGITAMLAIGAAMAAMLLMRRDIVAVVAGMAVAAPAGAVTVGGHAVACHDGTRCRCRTASIHSVSCSRILRRGTMFGNRGGRFHTDDRTLTGGAGRHATRCDGRGRALAWCNFKPHTGNYPTKSEGVNRKLFVSSISNGRGDLTSLGDRAANRRCRSSTGNQ